MSDRIRSLVQQARWKEDIHRLARETCATAENMRAVALLIDDADLVLARRASWVFHHGGEFFPQHVPPLVPLLLPPLDANRHPAIRRNVVRALQMVDLPEKQLGPVVSRCFDYLIDPAESVACRAFSVEVLWRACQQESELMPELEETLLAVMDHAKPGLRHRAKRTLRAIEKWRTTHG